MACEGRKNVAQVFGLQPGLGSWLQPGPAMLTVAIWGGDQENTSLFPFAFSLLNLYNGTS